MAISKIPSAGISNAINFRNLIINGDMSIHQREDAATANNKFGVDRFVYNDSNNFGQRAFEFQPNSDVPTGQGFAKCMKINMTTPETAIAAGEYARVMHRIEGQNLQQLKYGTSNAEKVTLSFWLKTNVTGNFGVSLFQDDDSRIVGTTYTQASSGTWEKIKITFDGDTTGVIDNNNGSGLRVMFMLSAGSDFTSSDNTSWGTYAGNKLGYGHTANLLGTTSGYWQVTGVQLEVGSQASDFEFLPFDVNLNRCKRYFVREYKDAAADYYCYPAKGQSSDTVRFNFFLSSTLRASPTVLQNGEWRVFSDSAFAGDSSTTASVLYYRENTSTITLEVAGYSGLTDNEIYNVAVKAMTSLDFDAEL